MARPHSLKVTETVRRDGTTKFTSAPAPARGRASRADRPPPRRGQPVDRDLQLPGDQASASRARVRVRHAPRPPTPCFVLVLAGTGLRVTELCDLEVGDVDLRHAKLQVLDARTEAGVREVYPHRPPRGRHHDLLQVTRSPSHQTTPASTGGRLGQFPERVAGPGRPLIS